MRRPQVERVLRLKRWRESVRRQREYEVSHAQAEYRQRLKEAGEAERLRERASRDLAASVARGEPGYQLSLMDRTWESARRAERHRQKTAREAEAEVERALETLVEARMRERMFEVLGEKRLETVRWAEMAQEQKEIDDIAGRKGVNA